MRTDNQNGLTERLRELPRIEPGRDVTDRTLAAMAAAAQAVDRSNESANGPRFDVIAVAASFLAVAVLVGFLVATALSPNRLDEQAGEASADWSIAPSESRTLPSSQNSSPGAVVLAGDAQAGIEPLIEVSQLLELALDSLPGQRRVMRADTASTIAALQTRIEVIDAQLGRADTGSVDPVAAEVLWRGRVEAMNALYQVRYAQSRQFSY